MNEYTIPKVVIVGRPNVGKSALFNRISGKRTSIVQEVPGVTIDRIECEISWQNKNFYLIDTGGIETEDKRSLNLNLKRAIQNQIKHALVEATLILWVVDAKDGINPQDLEVADILRKSQKPVVLVANKVESKKDKLNALEFLRMGMGKPYFVSAVAGSGIGELLDEVIKLIPSNFGIKEKLTDSIKVAIIGRPNVGKSSLFNKILGEERCVVDEVPGTTRDAIDVKIQKDGIGFTFIDTAGLRKKKRIEKKSLEYYSVNRALKAIKRSEVVLLVVDAKEGVHLQDKKIAGFIDKTARAVIIVVNKWDLIKKEDRKKIKEDYIKSIRQKLYFIDYAPIIFISALTGEAIDKIWDLIILVHKQYIRRIPTAELNKFLREAEENYSPPSSLKIYYITQSSTSPPTLIMFVNNPKNLHFSYHRYLKNRLRSIFGFEGTPVKWIIKARGKERKR